VEPSIAANLPSRGGIFLISRPIAQINRVGD
jgi:hypothetical protein